MGVYTKNRTQLGTYSSDEIVANESYTHQTGLLEMLVDNVKNDQAIFEAVITNDFKEAAGVLTESSEILNEAAGFVEKVKEFVKKCWEKIKGIFKSFITRINSVIIRDNKEFVNKYKKEVLSKDLSKMKYKWSQPKANAEDGADSIEELRKGTVLAYSNTMNPSTDIKKLEEDLNSGDFLEDMLGKAVKGSTTAVEFAKDFHEMLFEDPSEEEGLESGRLLNIINILTNSATTLKAVAKYEKDADKMFSSILKEIDKNRNANLKKIPGKTEEDKANVTEASEELKRQNVGYKVVQTMQTAGQKIIGAGIDATKFAIAQARRVFAQAAAFNAKAVKEDALLIEAVGEAAEFEVISSFEDYSA